MAEYEGVECGCGRDHFPGSKAYERHIVEGRWSGREPRTRDYYKGVQSQELRIQTLELALERLAKGTFAALNGKHWSEIAQEALNS